MNNNPSHNERFERLCAAYVLDALDDTELNAFETMLEEATDEERNIFHSFRWTANQLAFSVDEETPPDSVKAQILKHIADSPQEIDSTVVPVEETQKAEGGEEQSSRSRRYAYAMAASFALLLITVALVFYVFSQHATINDQQAKISSLQKNVQQKEQMLSILGARSVDLVVMNGLDVNPNGYGKVIWDANKQQALLQVSNLPAISSNKSYQLWLIKNNKPTSAGVFSVNQASGNSFFKVQQLAKANEKNANAFAVTLEPKGGSKQPTGDMYLLGNVGKSKKN